MNKILYTGASGFLGQNTLPRLGQLGYHVVSLGRSNGHILCDLSLCIPHLEQYTTVIHAAGKAHLVPVTDAHKQHFIEVNHRGTINLCLAMERSSIPNNFIFISSVAVYGLEQGEGIKEDTPLNGNTAYAQSKILAESFLQEWCQKHNVKLSILRPSLIAGVNPPGNLGAMIRGIETGKYVSIAHGVARKSVLMGIDIANLVPMLEKSGGGIFNICDDHHPSFHELEGLISKQLGKSRPYNVPLAIAKTMALIGDCVGNKFPFDSSKLNKIVKPLTFDNQKAKDQLNWQPLDVLSNFVIK